MSKLQTSRRQRSESESPAPSKPSVKVEVQDSLDEEHGPLSKRSKISSPLQRHWNTGSASSHQPANYNPLTEPSPLGLRLRKSPSLLDLIQMRLSQANSIGVLESNDSKLEMFKRKDVKSSCVAATTDKLKASNFPASLLRIGTWECVSRYEGDLVAKCYFAKHKLVWEVLDGGLKSKIEIQWSDIAALKASCSDNGPGALDIVLYRQPLFFREINPQPRKHTLWQATSDFTGGQASIQRRHFLQCPPGLLSKHVEKLIQCDPHLKFLIEQPDIVIDNPYFETRSSVFEDLDEPKCHKFDPVDSDHARSFSGSHDAASPCAAQSSSSMGELQDRVVPEAISSRTISPSSVVDSCAIEEVVNSETYNLKGQGVQTQFKVPGLAHSMSMSDFVSHIEHCISEQRSSGEGSCHQEMFDELTQYLLSDSQFSSASDERFMMSRVNSLFCLLQNAAPVEVKSEDGPGAEGTVKVELSSCKDKIVGDSAERECSDTSNSNQEAPAMARKDSLSDLLLHLPRIASLPKFLFNIMEDDNQAR